MKKNLFDIVSTMRIMGVVSREKEQVGEQKLALLAAEAQVDKRTARRALREGIEAIKGSFVQERLRAAAKKVGIEIAETVG